MKHLFLALTVIAITGCQFTPSMPNDGQHLLEKEIPQSLEETAMKLQLYNKRCIKYIDLEIYATDNTIAFNPSPDESRPMPIEYAESEDGISTMVYWYWNDKKGYFAYFTHGLTNPEKCAEDYSFAERMKGIE